MLHNMAKEWKEEDAPLQPGGPEIDLRIRRPLPVEDQELAPLEAGLRIRDQMRRSLLLIH